VGDIRFHPELFELRNDVLALLQSAGITWLTDYSSVGLVHENFGIEVCGIRDAETVNSILLLLRPRFPDWVWHYWHVNWQSREPGWVVVIQRDPEGRGADYSQL
jgi:hypothetical protein